MILPALLCGGLPVVAEAKIQTKTLPDGSTLIYNETKTQKARRTSDRLLRIPRSDISYWIDLHARQQGLSEKLVQAVVQVESGYNPRALSHKGAMGLMQLMPGTAAMLGVEDAFDPDQNIRGGTLYLRRMLEHFGSLELALAAYNAGPGAVERHDGIPPYRETRDYVDKVLRLYRGTVPRAFQEQARDQARERRQAERQAPPQRRGKKVYMTRDENNHVIFTTTPPTAN